MPAKYIRKTYTEGWENSEANYHIPTMVLCSCVKTFKEYSVDFSDERKVRDFFKKLEKETAHFKTRADLCELLVGNTSLISVFAVAIIIGVQELLRGGGTENDSLDIRSLVFTIVAINAAAALIEGIAKLLKTQAITAITTLEEVKREIIEIEKEIGVKVKTFNESALIDVTLEQIAANRKTAGLDYSKNPLFFKSYDEEAQAPQQPEEENSEKKKKIAKQKALKTKEEKKWYKCWV